MYYRIIAALSLFFISLLTIGCWDLKELQDRNFVLAVAIDSAQNTAVPDDKIATFKQSQGDKIYKLSLNIVKLTPPSGEEKTAKSAKTFTFSNTGKSMFEMVRDMLGQSSKSLYFEHLDAIIISEDAVKINGLTPILDFFRRDPEMRSRIKLFITPGEAKKILELPMPTGEANGQYLSGVLNNHKKDLHIAGARTDIGYISQRLDSKQDIMIPRLEASKDVLKVGGTAFFKGEKFMGYVDEYTTRGAKFIYGTEKSGVIPVECPLHPGETFVFELFEHDTKLVPHIDEEGNVYFTLDIRMEGNIGEITCPDRHATGDFTYIAQAEQSVAQSVTANVHHTLRFLQENHLDPLNFRETFKGYHPFEWKRIKDSWDDMYPDIPFYVSVNVSIRQVGEHY